MDFQGVSLLSSRVSFPPHFLKIVVEVKDSRPPHGLRLCLGVSKDILPVKYFRSNKAYFFSQLNFMKIIILSQI